MGSEMCIRDRMDNLEYTELKMRNYLTSKKVYPECAKMIFRYRTMTANCRANFRSMFRQDEVSESIMCPECQEEEDSQFHLLQHAVSGQDISVENLYKKLFSDNAEENLEVTLKLEQARNNRPKDE